MVRGWVSSPEMELLGCGDGLACRPGTAGCGDADAATDALVITESDLAFTGDEAGRLMEEVAGRSLSVEQTADLMAWSEGWPLAVRLVAAAVRAGVGVDEAVRGGEGVERYIRAFLHHEVLEREPVAVRRLLARTSVLHRFDAPLARFVDGHDDSDAALSRIERERLFIRRRPETDGLFEYFGPFREVLRRELREQEPASEARILTSAADWLTGHDRPEQAVPYLLEAEEWDGLIDLIDQTGPRLRRMGRLDDVVRWLGEVPVCTQERRSQVAVRQVFALNLLGESGRAEQISRYLPRQALSPGEQVVIEVLSAVRATHDLRPLDAVGSARRVLRELGSGNLEIPPVLGMADRGDLGWMASTALGQSLWQQGDIASSCSVFSQLMYRADGHGAVRSDAAAAMALSEAWAGHHGTARSRTEVILGRLGHNLRPGPGPVARTAPPRSVPAGAALAAAHLLREQGDLSGAERWLNRPEVQDQRNRSLLTATVSAIEKALWCLAMGRPDDGLAEIRLLELWSSNPLPPLLEGRLRSAETRLELARGDRARAESLLTTLETSLTPSLAGASVQSALAGNDIEVASQRLSAWPHTASDRLGDAEWQLWTAVLDFDAGRRRQALRRLGRLLPVAEEQRYVRLFLDGGPPVLRLLRSAAKLAPGSYAAMLLSAVAFSPPAAMSPSGLSAREREIIRYLPTPLSSAQMAARLYISVNTLKTHLRTIYRKLGVSGRRDAIIRAQEMGLA